MDDLPPEMQQRVFEYLPDADLLHIILACRKIESLAANVFKQKRRPVDTLYLLACPEEKKYLISINAELKCGDCTPTHATYQHGILHDSRVELMIRQRSILDGEYHGKTCMDHTVVIRTDMKSAVKEAARIIDMVFLYFDVSNTRLFVDPRASHAGTMPLSEAFGRNSMWSHLETELGQYFGQENLHPVIKIPVAEFHIPPQLSLLMRRIAPRLLEFNGSSKRLFDQYGKYMAGETETLILDCPIPWDDVDRLMEIHKSNIRIQCRARWSDESIIAVFAAHASGGPPRKIDFMTSSLGPSTDHQECRSMVDYRELLEAWRLSLPPSFMVQPGRHITMRDTREYVVITLH